MTTGEHQAVHIHESARRWLKIWSLAKYNSEYIRDWISTRKTLVSRMHTVFPSPVNIANPSLASLPLWMDSTFSNWLDV